MMQETIAKNYLIAGLRQYGIRQQTVYKTDALRYVRR